MSPLTRSSARVVVTTVDLAALDARPLEVDAGAELALLATDHPEVKRAGGRILEELQQADDVLTRCRDRIRVGELPKVSDLQASTRVLNGEICRLDDIDLSSLLPSWGDKATVRMARKSLIDVASEAIRRLDKLIAGIIALDAPVAEARTAGSAATRKRSRSRSPVGPRSALGRPSSARGADAPAEEPQSEEGAAVEAPRFRWVCGLSIGPSGRYSVQRLAGEGKFSCVLQCLDVVEDRAVAVKTARGAERCREALAAEVAVLRELKRCDPGGVSRCVRLIDAFPQPGFHDCAVFDLFEMSLSDHLKSTAHRGLLLRDIHSTARQLLQGLSFLHALGLMHTDIKCRNVMLRSGAADLVPLVRCGDGVTTRALRSCDVVIIDFGGAIYLHQARPKRPGTRQYRSPEALLGLQWNEKTDMWSLGCLLLTLYLGMRPFEATSPAEHLAQIVRVVGAELPRHMALRANASIGVDVAARDPLGQPRPLDELVSRLGHSPFLMLLRGLLQIDPGSRLSADEAASVPFIARRCDVLD